MTKQHVFIMASAGDLLCWRCKHCQLSIFSAQDYRALIGQPCDENRIQLDWGDDLVAA